MLGRHTPPAPLKRGALDAVFLFGNERFECDVFPSREGIEGCVTVRGAAGDKMLR